MKKWMWAALAITVAVAGVSAQSGSGAAQKPGGAQKPAPVVSGTPQAAPDVPDGELNLGTVRIPRAVMADGKPLKPGSYQGRLTAQEAKPDAVGQTEKMERWVEFLQGGKVVGREVVSIVPGAEIAQVADGTPPRPGGSKVELLKGNDYIRVWINRGGTHYLIHLPVATTT
jgi:hypothetical protein